MKVINRQSTINNHQLFYRILDLDVCLESDSRECLETFDRDYGWFKTLSTNGKKRLSISARLNDLKDPFVRITKTNNLQSSIFNFQSLRGHPSPMSCALQRVLRTIFTEIEDFMVLHAGVVERNGKAVILAGPPGAGKTTLVLALLKDGYGFFSDDFCPIHKVTRRVHPFPRSVWVADDGPNKGDETGRKGKSCIRPGKLPSGVSSKPCMPKCLVCLDPGRNADSFCELEVGVKREGEKGLGIDLQGIKNLQFSIVNGQSSDWRIRYPAGQGLTPKIRELLARHEQHIWNVYRVDRIHPDFEKDPVLTPIATHEAAFRLLRDLKQGPGFFQNGDTRRYAPGELFMELNRLLEGVPCYQLLAGRLDGLVGVIEELTIGWGIM
ncbi:MAG: hypothetical protein IMF18_11620 [Proteobacteria bacterium]|nr:hypothetical protein [Pseudomonadota bacterium]